MISQELIESRPISWKGDGYEFSDDSEYEEGGAPKTSEDDKDPEEKDPDEVGLDELDEEEEEEEGKDEE